MVWAAVDIPHHWIGSGQKSKSGKSRQRVAGPVCHIRYQTPDTISKFVINWVGINLSYTSIYLARGAERGSEEAAITAFCFESVRIRTVRSGSRA